MIGSWIRGFGREKMRMKSEGEKIIFEKKSSDMLIGLADWPTGHMDCVIDNYKEWPLSLIHI